MRAELRAELSKQARRPACWLLLAVTVLLSLTFGYLIPYAGYTGTASGAPAADRGLAAMLPAEFVGTAVAGLPVFAGALALIFGVLVAGSEYNWETWKTVFAQQPSRPRVYAVKVATVAAGSLLAVLALLGATATASAVIASLENQPMNWPSLAGILLGAGGGWLAATMWGSLGMLLAVALRAVALPIGLGLVWLLAVQNLLSSIAAPLLDWIADVQRVLPGPNVGALVAGLGAPAGTPGVEAIVGAGQAAAVVAGYLLVCCAAGGWLLARRDIT
ncbi:ABC transporter permease subunit [Amycolatopsis aidingensis]|uniref:ABC transporter permease subunit n=1 Tax=Amycolatopsis aidingensis TaxID=2842453 RepID=UPI001C0C85DE|nr:ABC transporter permease subunit [Amycolatopsis aidingensis]